MQYFLDELRLYELDIILSSLECSVKQSWEQIRQVCYTSVQAHSAKKVKCTDIMRFPWDKEKKGPAASKEEVERLFNKANKIFENGRFSDKVKAG